jgi:hypothetical protein
MSGPRAARQLVDACVAGRAHATPGLQFRLAEVLDVLTPRMTASLKALLASHVLPSAVGTAHGRVRRRTSDVGFGWLTPFLPNGAAAANNELG